MTDTWADVHRRGVTALNHRSFEDAETWLVASLAAAATPSESARSRVSLAFLTFERGDLAGAFRAVDDVVAQSEDGLDPNTVGVVRSQQALMLLRAGRTREALRAFATSIPLLSDPTERGRALINRGGVHLLQGGASAARADFEGAVAVFEEVGKQFEANMALHNLGYAEFLCGDLVGALQHLDRARPVLAAEGELGRATCSQDRAEVLLAAGLLHEGRRELEAASTAYARHGIPQRAAEAQLALAEAVATSDPEGSARAAEQARDTFESLGASVWRDRAAAIAWTSGVDAGRAGVDSLVSARELARGLAAHGQAPMAVSVRLHEARVRARSGDGAGARDVLRRVRMPAGAPLDARLLAAEVRAEVALGSGEGALARRHIRRGLADLHAWQSSFGSLDLQTNVVGHGVRLGVRGLQLAVGSRSHAVLFEWSERARMLASRVQPVRAPQDEQSVADLAELRTEPQPAREAELRQRIRERAWQHRGSGLVADPIPLAQLRGEVGSSSALVAYVVTADRVVALVVTDRGSRRHELGHRAALDLLLGGLLADLDMVASDLPPSLAGSVQTTLNARLAALAELLVTPLARDLGDRRVVLTPSGVLAGVPWTLLPGLTGRPVTVAQSATSWVVRQATPLRTANAGFVAGPRVPRAEAEVLAAAKEWGDPPVLVRAQARAEAVTALAGQVDVLHVAAHGRHSAENPLFSGLELVDGTWYGYDIDQVAAVPDVVLLSACEVGRSSVRWGEELIGMTAAWLHAGARCVLASPAAVNDEAAYDALVAVHAGLAAGLDPAAALAASAAPTSRPAGRPPAPFVCFG